MHVCIAMFYYRYNYKLYMNALTIFSVQFLYAQ